MIDFLRANTWCSQQQYQWQLTVPQIRLASFDFSHVEYTKTKKEKDVKKNTKSIDSMLARFLDGGENSIPVVDGNDSGKEVTDLGFPIIPPSE